MQDIKSDNMQGIKSDNMQDTKSDNMQGIKSDTKLSIISYQLTMPTHGLLPMLKKLRNGTY